ncbi:MAG: ammonia-forming cytochrome c nitrite reductase subunit c552 [Lachnospiraceae bacterium]|nr:ammonia-forming cytochrome c nitrite reductase subunit c552 [Lachnospiraceae bacterium]
MADKSLMTKLCISVIAVAGMVACAVAAPKYSIEPSGSEGGETAAVTIEYKQVDAPEAANPNNVVTAEQWAEIYPEICASYEANGENTYRVSYLADDQDPYLINIYEGYGFAKDYTSAIAHNYTLEDVANTERPHALANCLTCKTADFTALVNNMGKDAYSLNFEDVAPNMTENVGCYNCHENNAGNGGELTITHDYTKEALGDAGIDAKTLVCGQCHIEYYFNPEDKATSVAYNSVETMSPDAILEYYDSIGFSDWTQESTGTPLLKAQHPEMETFLGEGSVHASMGLNCASCHMEKVVSEDGVAYTSHALVSPLESEAILETCATCHADTDMKAKVAEIQEQVTARESEIGNALSDMKTKLAEAVASGAYTEDELNALRDLHRKAQWYFDFDYVENSEGAHNSKLANECLDKAADYIAQANALFK